MKKVLSIGLGLIFLASCSTSSDVASNKLFQKRKYKKGWHVNSTRNVEEKTKVIQSDEIVESKSIETKEEITYEQEVTSSAAVAQENVLTETADVVNAEESIKSKVVFQSREQLVVASEISNPIVEGVVSSIEKDVFTQNKNEKNKEDSSDDDMLILLYVLAVLIPFVAVGIVTDWDLETVLINILLSILCYIPGVIHAFIIIRDRY
ncbi:YqaE/Pmp3 family membrane protein [Flavobacteriales bacterium]|nr:YqaE/Pmp3 family membrane protein [Flavobacteriales bacterium]